MKKFALLFFIIVFSFVPAFSQVNEILKRMTAHRKALKSLNADITITKFSMQFGGTYTKEGTVKFIPQAKYYAFRLDSTKPAPKVLRQLIVNMLFTSQTSKPLILEQCPRGRLIHLCFFRS